MFDLHPTHNVVDSTKLQSYMSCPRAFFFEYTLGFRKEEPNVHLIFGSAWHKAMEQLLQTGYSDESIALAFMAFEEEYKTYFTDMDEAANAPKNLANAKRALVMYAEKYKNEDNFEVLYTEVAGTVLISDSPIRKLHMKIDGVCRRNDFGVFILEHKTGSNFSSSWAYQWEQKVQIGTYCHAAYCLFPPEEVYGIIINGAFIKNPPKLKLDGQPYAGAVDTHFERIEMRRTPRQMNDWLFMVNYWYGRLEEDMNILMTAGTEEADVMPCFAKQTESCSHYFGCPYRSICSAWSNPLQHIEYKPAGFKIEFWDPRDEEKTARKVVEL